MSEKKEGFFAQIKNQIIAGVGIILTTLGGIFIDEVKSFVGIEDDSEPQTEVVQENNQSVNVEGPTIVVNIPEQKTETKTIIKEVLIGAQNLNFVEILEGLDEGDIVVTETPHLLGNGQTIKPVFLFNNN